MSRVSKVIGDARSNHALRRFLASEHPGNDFPAWWHWTHVRRYLCVLTGGCAWGPLHPDHLFGDRPVRFCWKCRSSWANPLNTQNERPWRRARGPFLLLERFERWKHLRSLSRIVPDDEAPPA